MILSVGSRTESAEIELAMTAERAGWFEAACAESPFGVLVADGEGLILSTNRRSVEMLMEGESPPEGMRCCDVICEPLRQQRRGARRSACLTRRVSRAGEGPPEMRLEVEIDGALNSVFVTAASIESGEARVVFYLRAEHPLTTDPAARSRGRRGSRATRPRPPGLRIYTLGRTRVEAGGRDLGGDWLAQRPGQLLECLLCARHRVATSEQISEALWPAAKQPWTTSSVRHQIHMLRERLEPGREVDTPSQFVVTRRGGYMLDPDRVWIDADRFEDTARAGLDLFLQGELEDAAPRLEQAIGLYRGDFLSEDPYAEYALEERDRLRELAGRVLRDLVAMKRGAGDLAAAADHARRIAAMEPFDMDVQREFLELCIMRGRRSEAMRRYALLRRRVRSEFGHDLDFTLADLGG
jgi:DNA-binding SARP family transcriptional activator